MTPYGRSGMTSSLASLGRSLSILSLSLFLSIAVLLFSSSCCLDDCSYVACPLPLACSRREHLHRFAVSHTAPASGFSKA